jgi:mannitol-1-/sugar-/sorbitol-6-phosphatase
MVQITCSGMLFDLDGVLIDSTPAVTRAWSRWAVGHGLDSQFVTHYAHGRPSLETIRGLLPNSDLEYEHAWMERAEAQDVDGIVPLPGAIELLRALPPDRWTIVTSCTRELAAIRLRAGGLTAPQIMVTCSDVENGKPHPEPYLKAAKLLGFHAQDCVVVEDVPNGIRAGKAAGARVIAARTTTADPELKNAGADWIVDNCGDLSVVRADQQMMIAIK